MYEVVNSWCDTNDYADLTWFLDLTGACDLEWHFWSAVVYVLLLAQ